MLSKYLIAGEVLKPQGLDGLVKVRVDMDTPEMMMGLKTLYLSAEGGYQALSVLRSQIREGYAFLHFEGINSREQAEGIRGEMLYMKREDAPELPEGRHYICDLIGCNVYTKDKREVGTIREVLQPGANDVYVIQLKKGRMLLPALKKVVTHIDIQAQQIIIDENILDEVAVIED